MDYINRSTCVALDSSDALSSLRTQFFLPPGKIYLDGNSLGAMPLATADHVQHVVQQEWGYDLIESWNKSGWIHKSQTVGEKIARLIGAASGEVMVADSTSLNLYKVLSVAIQMAAQSQPNRRVILSDRDNFPTDLYMAQSLARQFGYTLRLVEHDQVYDNLTDEVAIVMLTHVNYRTGRMYDMADVSGHARWVGALTVWDLAHSAGAVCLDMNGCNADFAVGCGYKYLNGGPGAPAFLWVNKKHLEQIHRERLWQPLSGWMGHDKPFEFSVDYQPSPQITQFLCGTPSILALAALEKGVDTVLSCEAHGGMAALRKKSLALSDLFITLVEQRCAPWNLLLQTPKSHTERGSQVSFLRTEGGYSIIQALIARGVVGDFRSPGLLRFGLTPLYVRYVDVWDAVEHLREVLLSDEWRDPRFQQSHAVT